MQSAETKSRLYVKRILLELGIPVHRVGYEQLLCAIPRFAQDKQQAMCWELYPYIAKQLNHTDSRAVEYSIRMAVRHAWKKGDRSAWEKYFPGCKRAPTNKRFIATIAEYLE